MRVKKWSLINYTGNEGKTLKSQGLGLTPKQIHEQNVRDTDRNA